jgi:hypothetical protein
MACRLIDIWILRIWQYRPWKPGFQSFGFKNFVTVRQDNMNEVPAPRADCTWTGQQKHRWDSSILFWKDFTNWCFIGIYLAAKVNTCCNSEFSLESSLANKDKVSKNSESYSESYTRCSKSIKGEENNICIWKWHILKCNFVYIPP